MTAGKRAHAITIQVRTDNVSAAGTPVTVWETKANLRAEIIRQSTEEFQRGFGSSDETVIIFRTLHVEGISTADRVRFEGQSFDIREITRIGRRRGLELRCVATSGVI